MKVQSINKWIVAVAVAMVCTDSSVTAQIQTNQLQGGSINTITTAVPFLMITPDTRAGGMGETGVATTPDVNSIHWNAAKLAFEQKKMGLGISYTPWLRALVPDINLAYVSWYMKPKGSTNSAFGASMRYFSMGNITFTDIVGNTIGQYRPNEFAFDACYARKLGKHFSASMAGRFIHSSLTNGITVNNTDTKAGVAGAVDLSGYYYNPDIKLNGKKSTLMFGMAITNIGNKISYSSSVRRDFIPINLRMGAGMVIQADEYNKIGFQLEFNKLLVPTPPIYKTDPTTHSPIVDPNTGQYEIEKGKDPNRSVADGMFGSFNDAPGGFNEELKEINIGTGIEYWYNDLFAVRTGYFYEAPTKGNRQFFTLGAGVKYHVFGLDFAYLIPTNGQRSPLQNTLRFTLTFDFDAFNKQNEDAAGGDTGGK
ncbi:MAG: type IX secretion system outer membrane channel protein PorV [Bacteroidetes bacterium]|nr:type IX secretion system outer membrane channel protein PorV [Bacteroidota bacterium]